jgi:hypothetical protein
LKDQAKAFKDTAEKELKESVKGIKLPFKLDVNPDPRLHGKKNKTALFTFLLPDCSVACLSQGYWGRNWVHTLSHQSVLLGMPAFQLEIPHCVRSALTTNRDFLFQ